MTISTDKPVMWAGRRYFGADRLGFTADGSFVVSLHTTPPPEPRGGYFTTVPISNDDYRKKHPTKAAIERQRGRVAVYCDWGKPHYIGAPKEVLDAIMDEARSHGLPVRETPNVRANGLAPARSNE